MPAFALKQTETSEGAGLEEIHQQLKRVAGLEETVYRGPSADAAINLNANPVVLARPGSQFLLMAFNGPVSNRQWDSQQYAFIRWDETGHLQVAGSSALKLGREMKKPETVVPLGRPFALPAQVNLQETALPGPGPGPGGPVPIPAFPIQVSQEPEARGLRFEITQPPGPDQVLPLYLLFPLDRADLFDAVLWYQHELSIQILGALNDRPNPAVEFQVLGSGPGSLSRSVSASEAAQFLHQNPSGVLSVPPGSDNRFNLRPADQDSLSALLSNIRDLQARQVQLLPATAPPRQIGTLAVIAVPDNPRRFYTAAAREWAPRSTIIPARSPAEANRIALALGVKIDAALLELEGLKEKNWSVLYNQLGASLPAFFFGAAALRGAAEGKTKLPDQVFYARHPIGGLSGLQQILGRLDQQAASRKTGLEEETQRIQGALAYLAAFRVDAAPYGSVLERAGFNLNREIAAVESALESSSPRIESAAERLSLATTSFRTNPQIPSDVKRALSLPLFRAVEILSASPAGAEERGPEILAPRTVEGSKIYGLLQNYRFEKGLEVRFFRPGRADSDARSSWSMITGPGIMKAGFETRLAEVMRDYAAAEKSYSVAVYETAAPVKQPRGIERIAEIRPVPPAGLEENFRAAVLQYVETLGEANYSASKFNRAEAGSRLQSTWQGLYARDSVDLSFSAIALAHAARKGFPAAEVAVSKARRLLDANLPNFEALLMNVARLTPEQVRQNLSQLIESAFSAGAEEGIQEILLVSANKQDQAAWLGAARQTRIQLIIAPTLQEGIDQLEILQLFHLADTRFGVVVDLSVAPSARRVLDFIALVNPVKRERTVPTAVLITDAKPTSDLVALEKSGQITHISVGDKGVGGLGYQDVLARLNAAATGPSAGLEQPALPAVREPRVEPVPAQPRVVGFAMDAGIALVMPSDVAKGTRYRIIAESSPQIRALADSGIPAHNLIALVAGLEEKQWAASLGVPEASIFSVDQFGGDWARLRGFAWQQAQESLKAYDNVDEVLVLRTPLTARTPEELLAGLEGILPLDWQERQPIDMERVRTILLVYELGV